MNALLEKETLVPKPPIIWLEDDEQNQRIKDIKELLETKYDCQVELVSSQDEAIKLAQTNQIFILDIHMGISREQEGLDALNIIKKKNPNAFVCMFSAHSEYERLAENLGCDLFIHKTEKVQEDSNRIISAILNYKLKRIKLLEQEILQQLVNIDVESSPSDLDPNIQAYKDSIEDPNWFNQYNRKYVAFLNGKLVDSDQDRDALLERLSNNYSNQSCLCKQVSKKTRIIDIPYYDIVG